MASAISCKIGVASFVFNLSIKLDFLIFKYSSSKNTSQNYFNQISNTDVNSNTLLQPTQSRLDYLNIQNTNTSSSSLNTSINEQQNQSNQINTQKENIYDKAVNFFSPSI